MPGTVLVIDDDAATRAIVESALGHVGYQVITADDGESGLDVARRHAPDLVVLDIMLPRLDGLEVCRRLRAEAATARLPILMLTALSEEADRVVGLEIGADDYLPKPFGVRELIARVRALLRRAAAPGGADDEALLRAGDLVVDPGARRVTLPSGDAVELTKTEFDLLRALAERPGRVLTREELIGRYRTGIAAVTDRSVDVHLVGLRRKLGPFGDRIETVHGVGYRLRG